MKKRIIPALALLSLAIFIGSVYLWVESPGVTLFFATQSRTYSFHPSWGRWQIGVMYPIAPTGLPIANPRLLIEAPLWPITLSAAVLPSFWLWRRKRRLDAAKKGFPVPRKNE